MSYHLHVSYEKHNSFEVFKVDVTRTSSFPQNHVHTLKKKQYLVAQNAKIELLVNTYIKGNKNTDEAGQGVQDVAGQVRSAQAGQFNARQGKARQA
jgi:hypothetical protein